MRTLLSFAFLATFCLSSAVHAQSKNIVETAVAAGQFKTLAAALKAAGLVDTLQGNGPFTVFAPTDEAFAKLPAGTVETLLKPENKSKLTAILTYHVTSGKVYAKQVVGLAGAKTLQGQRIEIQVDGDSVKLDDASVLKTDIACSNGVIHVIDSVLIPSEDNLVATAQNAGTFSTLLAAAKAAGLVDALSGDNELTVFAPTDDAFAKLPKDTVASLLKPENKAKLAAILKYHVVAGRVYSDEALAAQKAKTLEGSSVKIGFRSGGAYVNGAKIVATDIDATNGVVHVIDTVLLPPEKPTKLGRNGVMRTLAETVATGSHMFNAGDHHGCAAHYEAQLRSLMSANISEAMKRQMSSTLSSIKHMHSATDKAWAMRHTIDRMYTSLSNSH